MTPQSGFISLMNDGLLVTGVVKSGTCLENGHSDALLRFYSDLFWEKTKLTFLKVCCDYTNIWLKNYASDRKKKNLQNMSTGGRGGGG